MQTNDQLVVSVVNGEIFKRVNNNENFTAHQITQEVRNILGTSVMVDHNDVKSLVHAAFLNGNIKNYERELDYSIGVSPAPFRYKPKNSNTSVMINQPRVTQQNVTSNNPILQAAGLDAINVGRLNSVGVNTPSTVSPQAAQAAGTSSVVSRSGNTLRLLKDVLNKAGFRSGEQAYVTYMPSAKSIFVTKNRPSFTSDPQAVTRPYSVDSKQNIRVSLSSIGAENAKSFIAVPKSNQIDISCV